MKVKDRETIFHVRTSLLYNEGESWIKRQTNHFTMTMGSYNEAEICELISIFMLSLNAIKYNPNSIRVYRDDELVHRVNRVTHNLKKLNRFKKKTFKNKGLDIIMKRNLKTVNYLDVTLNLNGGSSRPYKKPD